MCYFLYITCYYRYLNHMNTVDITSTITVGNTSFEQYIFHVTGCPSFAATDVPTTFAEAPIGVALPPISVPIESDHASTESYGWCAGKVSYDRYHSSGKRYIINKCTCNSRNPDYYSYHKHQVAAADLLNKRSNYFKYMCLFKTAYYYEQAYEEQQGFIINFLQKFRYMFKRCNKSNHCNKYSYKCNSKTCLRMCYKKNDCCQEYKAACNKACFVVIASAGLG